MIRRANDEKIIALENSIASIEMEWFVFSNDEKELCMAALDGKITKEYFIKLLLKKYRICLDIVYINFKTVVIKSVFFQ